MAGISQLGYLVFEVSDPDAWESFATRVLGLTVAERHPGGGFSLRMDDHKQRFFITPGPRDDMVAVGLQVDSSADIDAASDRLRAAGVEVRDGSSEQASARDVAGLVQFTEPAGQTIEIFHGPAMGAAPFRSDVLVGPFVADDMGLGHAVFRSNNVEESAAFFCDNVGFIWSDRITCDLSGYMVDIIFTHTNARHHTVAFGERLPKSIHHFMLESRSIDDMGMAYDRAQDNGVKIIQTIGRHPNDQMISFYALTPSGFQFEFGWGGRTINDDNWEPQVYDRISDWGHRRPKYKSVKAG